MPESNWLTSSPADPQRVRAAREELLSHGLLAEPAGGLGVRDVIERSWRRCVADAVPTVRTELPHADVEDAHEALRDAAAPVLQRLSEHLADIPVAMFVSNDRGHIVLRHAQEWAHRRLLDRASAAEGFDFSEQSIGTNGMGTVLAERRPVLINGPEHYSDLLVPFTCAATPIVEPFTGRLLGSFSLACSVKESSPLMYGLTTDVGRQIEQNLTSMLGAREQVLIRAYLMAENTSRDPVLVVTDRTVFANVAGVPHLDSDSHAMLWDHLTELPTRSGPVRARVPLPGGWQDALVEPVEGGGTRARAWTVRLLSPATAHPPAPRLPRARTSAEVPAPAPLADERACVVFVGGPGTGKMHRAHASLRSTYGEDVEVHVLDASAMRPGQGNQWSAACIDAVEAGRPVVVRHLQDLPAEEVNRLHAVAREARDSGQSLALVITADLDGALDHVQLLAEELGPSVSVPSLADEPHGVPKLITALLTELAPAQTRPRLTSDALRSLMHWSWPGNVAELRGVLLRLVQTHPGTTVRAVDLPPRIQQGEARRTPTLLESAERQAIVQALHEADGNRSRAAELLGVGRTTLYRKIKQLRIDV